jgi:hypothetical protein
MFEQSLYGQDITEKVESHEGDLFHNYEIKNWEITPHLYKIIGVSAAINILALIIVGQTSLLTMKGCDSPFVSRVCQVLDTVYVGSVLFGTEREYVDAAYERTNLAEADITFVDVSNETPPLEYPEGYFALANPDTYNQMLQQPGSDPMNGFTNLPTAPDPQNSLLNTTPTLPPSNPNAVIGELPSSPMGDTPPVKNPRRVRTPKLPDNANTEASNSNTVANTNTAEKPGNTDANTAVDEAKQDQYGVFINKRPMKDLAKDAIAKIDAQAVTLDKPFKVTIAGTLGLGKDGKTIVLKNPKVVRAKDDPKNDPELEKLAQNAIIAVGDAGWLGYLDKLKTKSVVITVEQNDTDLVAVLRADQPSENDAKVMASGLSTLLAIATPAAKGDDQTFLSKAQTGAEGKTFVLNFKLPKKDVQDMIMRKLSELKASEGKPNSSAQANSSENTAVK